MSRIVLFLLLCGIVATPALVAQDHVAVGAYADYAADFSHQLLRA